MPPPLLIDLHKVDLNATLIDKTRIYTEFLPHRHEFGVLDGICFADVERMQMVAYADVHVDDWWVRGHVPGRPLLPGVLMLEMAAQTAAVLAKLVGGLTGFIGFGGIDECRFRETVVPPDRLHILAVGRDQRPRRIVSATQGFAHGKQIFEARVTGLMME